MMRDSDLDALAVALQRDVRAYSTLPPEDAAKLHASLLRAHKSASYYEHAPGWERNTPIDMQACPSLLT